MQTRCPACRTVFRLRPDQLEARAGLVRCGFCYQAFNALEHRLAPDEAADEDDAQALTPPPAASPRLAVADTRTPATQPEPASAADEAPATTRESLIARAAAAAPASRAPAGPIDRGPAAGSAPRPAAPMPDGPAVLRKPRSAAPQAADTASLLTRPDSGVEAERPHDVAGTRPREIATAPSRPTAQAQPVNTKMDSARLDTAYGRPASAPNPFQRTLGGLAAGLLAGILAVQATYLFRTEIARELPGLRPLLVSACAAFGCAVPLPREVEWLSLESSDLQSEPNRPGRYVLLTTLRNRAEHPLALPHLELTLTDAADRPVARRVMPPADWLPAHAADTALEARTSMAIRVNFEIRELMPTGYRIHVFYP